MTVAGTGRVALISFLNVVGMLAAMREWRYPLHFSRHVMHEDVCRCNSVVADRTDSGAFYPATIKK